MAKRRVKKLRKDGVRQHYWVGRKPIRRKRRGKPREKLGKPKPIPKVHFFRAEGRLRRTRVPRREADLFDLYKSLSLEESTLKTAKEQNDKELIPIVEQRIKEIEGRIEEKTGKPVIRFDDDKVLLPKMSSVEPEPYIDKVAEQKKRLRQLLKAFG